MVPSILLTSFFTDNQCIKEIDGWDPDATTHRHHGTGGAKQALSRGHWPKSRQDIQGDTGMAVKKFPSGSLCRIGVELS